MPWALYSDRSLALRHKLETSAIERFGPIVQRVIDQGVREGSLHPVDSEHAVELLLLWQAAVAKKVGSLALAVRTDPGVPREILSWLDVAERGTERLLGMPPGSLSLYDREVVAASSKPVAETGGET